MFTWLSRKSYTPSLVGFWMKSRWKKKKKYCICFDIFLPKYLKRLHFFFIYLKFKVWIFEYYWIKFIKQAEIFITWFVEFPKYLKVEYEVANAFQNLPSFNSINAHDTFDALVCLSNLSSWALLRFKCHQVFRFQCVTNITVVIFKMESYRRLNFHPRYAFGKCHKYGILQIKSRCKIMSAIFLRSWILRKVFEGEILSQTCPST